MTGSVNNMQPFGLNVVPTKTMLEMKSSVGEAIGSIWTPVLDYIESNENVFSGDVAKEIESYNMQTMQLGMTMRKDAEKHSINLKG